jgi:hypothetical protein
MKMQCKQQTETGKNMAKLNHQRMVATNINYRTRYVLTKTTKNMKEPQQIRATKIKK